MVILGGAGSQLLGLKNWDSTWDTYLSKTEIALSGIGYFLFSGYSYYLFRTNWEYALLYYDEVLQERHEEVVQFGQPEKEDDLPEERQDQLNAQQNWQVYVVDA